MICSTVGIASQLFFFSSHLIGTLRAANTENTDVKVTAVSFIWLQKNTFCLSFPLQSWNCRQISSLGKKYRKKDSLGCQLEKISQYLLTHGQILQGAVCLQLPFKSKGNEDAQHFQGWVFAISAFCQWRCLRTTIADLPETVARGLTPQWGSDPMQKVAQARYHSRGILHELQKLQHHFLCRSHICVGFASDTACRVVARHQVKP